jgi:hypothetical protein
MVDILCTHARKWKNETLGWREGKGLKENGGGCKFNHEIF